MVDYQLIKQEIEQEYNLIMGGRQSDKNRLFELLSQYIQRTIEITIRNGCQPNKDDVTEIMQNTMLAILETGLYKYKNEGKNFAGYCCMIARNKAIDYIKRRRRDEITKIAIDKDLDLSEDEKLDYLIYHHSTENLSSPENTLIAIEYQLEHIGMLKHFIGKIMNQKEKAYKTIGCIYTMLLFQLLNPRTKELSSPSWAYEKLKEHSIQASADHFLEEFNRRTKIKLYWGNNFLDSMESEEDGILICDIIFGERFKRKDLENWSIRFRNKLKDEICYEFD